MNVDAPNYGDRTARIEIEYTNDKDGGDVRHRYLEIEQRALVKVDATWQGILNDSHINTWMEYYEEYLEHNDPLDKHEMPAELYSGLRWGLRGKEVKDIVRRDDGCLMYRLKDEDDRWGDLGWNGNDPFEYSKAIISYRENNAVLCPLSSVKLYNSEEPFSAFHYVMGKNKRKSDGDLPDNITTGWYMPGIREIEVAFVQHYVTFSDFRGNLYWSAACGATRDVNPSEQSNNARATRVTFTGNTPTYISSTGNKEGAQDRNNRLRIRAFYKAK